MNQCLWPLGHHGRIRERLFLQIKKSIFVELERTNYWARIRSNPSNLKSIICVSFISNKKFVKNKIQNSALHFGWFVWQDGFPQNPSVYQKCSTWMTSCVQFEKTEGLSFWTDIWVKSWRRTGQVIGFRGYIGFRGCHSKNRLQYLSKIRSPYFICHGFYFFDRLHDPCILVDLFGKMVSRKTQVLIRNVSITIVYQR